MSVGVDYWGAKWRRIAPHHYQSGFPIPFTDLGEHGVGAIVLAAEELQPDKDDVAFIQKQCPNLTIIRAPLEDTESPSAQPRIIEIANAVAERVAKLVEDRRCLVTCAAGRNRSGLISALTLIKRYGMPGRDAIAQVREADGGNRLALSNRAFVAYLEKL